MTNSRKISLIGYFAPDIVAEIEKRVPAGYDFDAVKDGSREELLRVIGDADYLIGFGEWKIDADVLAHAPKLRFIQKWGIGIDKYDLDALRERGIPIAITAGVNSIAVAEMAMTLILAVLKRLVVLDSTTRAGKFYKTELRMSSFELADKTVGIIGLGNIGRRVAKRVLGFEPKEVLYHDIVRQDKAERDLGVRFVERDELLKRADVITLHVPLDDTTRHMIGAPELTLMKKTAIVVNTCRGGVIDEPALLEALREKRILGAGIDVFEKEPTKADNGFFALDNIVVTPHASGATYENVCNVAQHCFDNIVRFHEGRPLPPEDVIGGRKS
jgi:D-3-phosphoglycerate dehydrogenase / 2-oxoglutarate reductase